MLRFSTSQIEQFNINNLRIALYNYIVAKQKDDGFIIRIDDLEQQSIKINDGEILDILKKFSIKDEQMVYQSKNLNIYQNFAYKLVTNGKAFVCFCNSDIDKCNCDKLSIDEIKELKEQNSKYVIKIKKPNKLYSFIDVIQGKQEQNFNELDSFTILNNDGVPTYNFACAIDDMSMNVTTIIRDKKFLTDTHKQLYIQHSLGYNSDVEYAHIDEITNSITIKSLFEQGFLPDAIINYIFSLDSQKSEIFYLPDVIKWFDIHKIPKGSIEFDIQKLKDINQKHLLQIDSKKLSQLFGFSDSDIGELLKIFLEESSTINELESRLKLIFAPKLVPKKYSKSMRLLSSIILDAPMIDSFEEFKHYLSQQSGLEDESLYKPLALLLTGSEDTSKLEAIYKLIKPYLLEVAQCQ